METPHDAEAPAPQTPRLYTVQTVAELLGVSIRYVWQLLADGDLSAVRLTRRRTLIRDDELAVYIDAHTEKTAS